MKRIYRRRFIQVFVFSFLEKSLHYILSGKIKLSNRTHSSFAFTYSLIRTPIFLVDTAQLTTFYASWGHTLVSDGTEAERCFAHLSPKKATYLVGHIFHGLSRTILNLRTLKHPQLYQLRKLQTLQEL